MKEKTLKERWQSKTPKFWKRVQRWAIVTGAAAGVILAAPITLPAIVITMAGYAVTAGTVAATLSQLTVDDDVDKKDVTENK
jgi:Mg/Co/Ni transporter MgtE